jgi:hypothetical protein
LPIRRIVIIRASVSGVGGALAYKTIRTKKREELFSKVNLDEIEDKYDNQELIEQEKEQWTQIQTKAKPKPQPVTFSKAGIEFSAEEQTGVSTAKRMTPQTYWRRELGKLISQAISLELEGDKAKSLVLYRMILRISKKTNRTTLNQKIKEKVRELYRTANP